MKHLIFITEASNSVPARTNDACYIPLRWEAALSLRSSQLPDRVIPSLDPRSYAETVQEAEESWIDHLEVSADRRVTELNSYYSFLGALGLASVRRKVAAALRRFPGASVQLPSAPLSYIFSSARELDQHDFYLRLLYLGTTAVIREEASERTVSEFEMPDPQIGTLSQLWQPSLQNQLIERLALAAHRNINTLANLHQQKMRATPQDPSALLVVGPWQKLELMTRALRKAGVPYTYETRWPVTTTYSGSVLSPDYDSRKLLASYMLHRDDRLADSVELSKQLVDLKGWSSILTTDQWDPHIRAINAASSRIRKSIFFAETGQPLTDATWRTRKHFYWLDTESVQMVASASDYQFLARRAGYAKLEVAGYLGNTEVSISTMLQTWLLRLYLTMTFFMRYGFKRPVLVSGEIYGAFEFVDGNESYQAFCDLLETLPQKYPVIVKLRHGHRLTELRAAFPGVIFFQYFRWQALAKICRLVIHQDSLIALEALSLRIPVIRYHPFSYPLASDAYSSAIGSAIRTVRHRQNLLGAVADVRAGRQYDFSMSHRFFPSVRFRKLRARLIAVDIRAHSKRN